MKNFSEQQTKELNTLQAVIDRGAVLIETGTFAQRHPLLGKMVCCPFCRRRKRQFDPIVCCNSKFKEGTENMKVRPAFRRKNPRLTRQRPPFFLVHQLLVEHEAAGLPEYDGLAGVVEARVTRARRAKADLKTAQQKLSRKINRP